MRVETLEGIIAVDFLGSSGSEDSGGDENRSDIEIRPRQIGQLVLVLCRQVPMHLLQNTCLHIVITASVGGQ